MKKIYFDIYGFHFSFLLNLTQSTQARVYERPATNGREPDPKRNQMLNANQLDVVLLPLVAFDQQGGRLGMGGGFYDRTFAFLNNNSLQKPKLIGFAHHFQQVPQLPVESWDMPLSAIVTDEQVIHVS